MTPPPPNPPAAIFGYVVVAAALIIVVKWFQPSKLDAIPTVGSSSWLGSWWAGLRYQANAPTILQEGYEKHKSAPFKVAELRRWIVVLTNRKHIEELRRAPDDTISFTEAVQDNLYIKYTMGPEIHHNPYHVRIVRTRLTRNVGALYPEIIDEIRTAFHDVLNLSGNEWKSVPVLNSMQKVICRTSNRVFVGLPLCRDPDWMDLTIQYTGVIFRGSANIRPFPDWLKPTAIRLFTSIRQSQQRGRELLGPIIEERLRSLNEHGNEWADKPNDFLSWLVEDAEGPELTVKSLTTRILAVNVAGIHTTSNSFTHALFDLAANPQYIQPLREEIETVIKEEGWSKAALGKMRKVDSFLKESQRHNGTASVGMGRKALKDFTFSDGTFVPKGTTIVTATRSIHHDEEFYENADTFDPFRFADLREGDSEALKYQYASTTTEYMAFGLGRHACPGRFFVSSEFKSMLAHLLVTYDIKLADGAMRPRTLRFGVAIRPDPSARVMFRRRVN